MLIVRQTRTKTGPEGVLMYLYGTSLFASTLIFGGVDTIMEGVQQSDDARRLSHVVISTTT
jgi:hypothetical protein